MSPRAVRARNARMAWLLALVAAAIALGAMWALANHRAQTRTIPGAMVTLPRGALAASAGAAHPHGPDETPTRSRPRWSGPGAVPMWRGGGRHPVWRGCQHVYDPTLGKFIFSSPSPPPVST